MASTRRFIGGRWVDVPDRPNDVLANIRRNNGGKTISETTASAEGQYIPRDKRYREAFDFLLDSRAAPAVRQRSAAVKSVEDAGGSVIYTGRGATGIKVKGPSQSPMAGAGDTRGLSWDAVRAGIHQRATDTVLDTRWFAGHHAAVDTASEDSKKQVLGEFDKAVTAEKDRLAGQFADNLVKSVQDNVEKTWKPTAPTVTQTAEASAREKVGTGATPEERRGNLDTWNAARQVAHAEEAEHRKQTEKYLDDTQKWIDSMKGQLGASAAAKGGSARVLPVSRSEDRFLDDLIGEMEV